MRGWALALALLLFAGGIAKSEGLTHRTKRRDTTLWVNRAVHVISGKQPASHTFYYSWDGSTWSSTFAPGNGSPRGISSELNYSQEVVLDFTESEGSRTVTIAEKTFTLYLRYGSSGPADYEVEVNLPSQEVEIVWGSPEDSTIYWLEPLVIHLTSPGEPLGIEDPYAGPETEKEIEGGILLLDNLTGTGLELDFGDEALRLQPGYNAFPFYGEVEEGFPKAIGDDWQLTRVVGADGQTYWVGRIAPGSEGGPEWVAPPSAAEIQVMPPQTGQTGPTVKIPNGASEGDLKDYVTLPAGMTKGNNVPLPGGMSPGNGTPKGVTPGDAGALKDGVISGGTSYLPSGYSAGTVQGNSPADPGVPKDGTTGKNPGAVVQKDSGGEDDAGPYIAGPSLDGLLEEGRELGQEAADRVGVEIGEGLGELAQTVSVFGPGASDYFLPEWSAPPATFFGGADKSWLNFELPIGTQMVQIEVPENIINLIRAILLWVVKIVFVMACIRVAMR